MMLRDARLRGWIIQGALLLGIALVAVLLVSTTLANLKTRGIPVGIDFLAAPSSIIISESILAHEPGDSHLRAIGVGIANTLFISALVILMSSAFGLIVGLARLSGNPLAAGIGRVWVEVARNFPPIVILIFLYSIWWKIFPPIDEAWTLLPGVTLSMRGLDLRGVEFTPELATILIGLTIYTTGFVAEIVRAGVLAIGKGQWEAGRSLGLSRGKILRFIVIPQTLRVVVPPLNSQYINVVKNSTLAIAVGYPDFLAVMNTMISKTSHSIEGVLIILVVYLAINLSLSALANWYNRRIALVER